VNNLAVSSIDFIIFESGKKSVLDSKMTFSIVVEGNIGSGKSTFIERLSKEMSDMVQVLKEPVRKNICLNHYRYPALHRNYMCFCVLSVTKKSKNNIKNDAVSDNDNDALVKDWF